MNTKPEDYMDYALRDDLLNDRLQGNEAAFLNYIVNTKGRTLPDDIKKDLKAINHKISGIFGEYGRKESKNPEASEDYYQEASAKAELLQNFRNENEYPATDDPHRDEKLRSLLQKFMDEVYGRI